jgi:transcriptional regulator with XRE-family HTH domain
VSMEADNGAASGEMEPAGQTLAVRIEWLIQHMWPKDAPPPKTNLEVAAAITAVTGEELSSTGIWKLRTGRGANPTLRTLNSLAQFFKVPIGYFGEDHELAEAIGDELAILVLLREKGISGADLRSLVGLSSDSRELIVDVIHSAARIEERRSAADHPGDAGEPA